MENTEQDRKFITLAFTPLIICPALLVFALLIFLSMPVDNSLYYMLGVFALCIILLLSSAMGYKQIINKSKKTSKSYKILMVLNVIFLILAMIYEALPLVGGGDMAQ